MVAILNEGGEVRVNTYTIADQADPKISYLMDGTYVITWDSNGQDGSAYGVYAQHYSATGVRLGAEIHVTTVTTSSQAGPAVTGLIDGSYVITWDSSDGREAGYGIYSQMFSASGVKIGGEVHVNTVTAADQIQPAVAGLAYGGYVTAWTSSSDATPNTYSVSAQMFDATGAKVGGEISVNTFSTGDQDAPVIAGLANGGFVIAYESNGIDNDGFGIAVQRFDESGARIGTEVVANTQNGGEERSPAITALADGGYVVAWEQYNADGSDGVYFHRFDANGLRYNYDDTQVNTTTIGDQFAPSVTGLDTGGFVVVWTSFGVDGSGYGVVAQVYDADGNPVGPETQVNANGYLTQEAPHVTALSDGGFAVTWQSNEQDGNGYGIYQRTFSHANGLSGAQYLYGDGSNDVLDGGSGGDYMYGGNGDDIYVVNSLSDHLFEWANAGIDTVQSSVNYELDANIENLTLTGTAAIVGYGNELDNIIQGNAGANIIDAGAGDDTIMAGDGKDTVLAGDGNDYVEGGSGDDLISGDAGNDELIGGTGKDVMTGGDGNDYVYGGDQDDTIYASAGRDHLYGDAGADTYNVSELYLFGATVDLGHGKATQGAGNIAYLDGFENIVGSSNADSLTGNAGNNVIDGGNGADKMYGGNGDDTYVVDDTGDKVTESADATLGGVDEVTTYVNFTLGNYIENLTLLDTDNINGTGNSLDNLITGNDGNNMLDGKAGSDTLIGGLGDDTYTVDVATDTIVELPGEGTDTVKAAFNYTLATDLENLVLTGTGDFSATGNAGNNTLTGNTGNNILDGGSGADTMSGGAGNDTYIVDNAGDIVNDFSNSGTDTILSSVTYSLVGRFVETLQLTGSSNINATGNSSANTLIGNTGNNSLTGGAGADIFLFQTASHADTITDFKSSEGDSIDASAYHAVAHTVTASGTSVLIDFGGGNVVTVLHATVSDVTAHTIF